MSYVVEAIIVESYYFITLSLLNTASVLDAFIFIACLPVQDRDG
jgi:hypothetical protein